MFVRLQFVHSVGGPYAYAVRFVSLSPRTQHAAAAANLRIAVSLPLTVSMTQILKLGFQNLSNLTRKFCSFAVIPRNLKLRDLRTTGSRRLLCYSSAKMGKSMDVKPKTGRVFVKESVVKARKVETEIIGADSDIERMTVQELRSKLRSVGLPAKGCKRDLVSALRGFLNCKADGDGSLVAEDHKSSEMKLICSGKKSSKRKTISSSAEVHIQEVNTVLKVSERQCVKRREKQVYAEDGIEDAKTTIVTTSQKLSIKTAEVSGKKPSQLKGKATPEIANTVVGASGEANLSIAQDEPWTILAHKKPQKGWLAYNPRTMRPPPLTGNTKSVKLMSWNVNGLRALLKLERFSALQLAQREDFDVLCLQETKLQASFIFYFPSSSRNLLAFRSLHLP
ncbi:apurinic endonuclease-redox protein [Actinidia rufa]|uniref:Apurinic endonuclease-redox protein n=1 Tax=Actinidia rufa TaxID=165716 RepID=A0A7J0FHL4_9ERIC|nr:apurinic endonuclease-redox protein [Actinidia rufa]